MNRSYKCQTAGVEGGASVGRCQPGQPRRGTECALVHRGSALSQKAVAESTGHREQSWVLPPYLRLRFRLRPGAFVAFASLALGISQHLAVQNRTSLSGGVCQDISNNTDTTSSLSSLAASMGVLLPTHRAGVRETRGWAPV